MGIAGVAMLIMALTLVVLVAVIIPAVIELRKTIAAARETLGRLEAELLPMMQELRAAVSDVKSVSGEVSAKREDIATFIGALGDTGRSVKSVNSAIGAVTNVISGSSLWMIGAKTGAKFVIDRILRKGEKKNG